ncbi:uncharacterized protein LOC118486552 [Helianthus annuus]|uniref:uncharacterized protein LOC118486552 n=1 Tax=Helianthus annuus TaxID=4232 RepID=UPI00165310FF|nr:uncharacterized protein LOC118486552 [Helianthus annuus]
MTKETPPGSSTKPAISLHPAYSVTNIQTKIPTLDGSKVTYSSWVKLFQLHAVTLHIRSPITLTRHLRLLTQHQNMTYGRNLMPVWIYSTVSDDLLVRILETGSTARTTRLKLEKIFLSNKKARAAALETKFVNLTVAACASLDNYSQQLKALANQLANVDHPVSESHLAGSS